MEYGVYNLILAKSRSYDALKRYLRETLGWEKEDIRKATRAGRASIQAGPPTRRRLRKPRQEVGHPERERAKRLIVCGVSMSKLKATFPEVAENTLRQWKRRYKEET